MPSVNGFNGTAKQWLMRVSASIVVGAIGGVWIFASTRASTEEVAKVHAEVIAEHAYVDKHIDESENVDKELQKAVNRVDRNLTRIGTVLDRWDRQNGGPGIKVEDPK